MLSSICVMASKWLSSVVRDSPGAIWRRVSISTFAKSRTLLRDARLVSNVSAAGAAAANPFPGSTNAGGTKFENKVLERLSGLRLGLSGMFSWPGPENAPTDCFDVEYDRTLVE